MLSHLCSSLSKCHRKARQWPVSWRALKVIFKASPGMCLAWRCPQLGDVPFSCPAITRTGLPASLGRLRWMNGWMEKGRGMGKHTQVSLLLVSCWTCRISNDLKNPTVSSLKKLGAVQVLILSIQSCVNYSLYWKEDPHTQVNLLWSKSLISSTAHTYLSLSLLLFVTADNWLASDLQTLITRGLQ